MPCVPSEKCRPQIFSADDGHKGRLNKGRLNEFSLDGHNDGFDTAVRQLAGAASCCSSFCCCRAASPQP